MQFGVRYAPDLYLILEGVDNRSSDNYQPGGNVAKKGKGKSQKSKKDNHGMQKHAQKTFFLHRIKLIRLKNKVADKMR
ncbi:MAG: hypothetical protein V1692_02105 [bacterium]